MWYTCALTEKSRALEKVPSSRMFGHLPEKILKDKSFFYNVLLFHFFENNNKCYTSVGGTLPHKLPPYQYLARPTSMLFMHFVHTQISVVMTRCQIGHTWIAHLCLQRGQEQPICQLCDLSLNVKQLLLHCNHLATVRWKYFTI